MIPDGGWRSPLPFSAPATVFLCPISSRQLHCRGFCLRKKPMNHQTPVAFTAESLTCQRGGRVVFADLSFRLCTGAAVMLLGPNGSGKSSLLRVLAGLLKPIQGGLNWNDLKAGDDPEAHVARLHYVGHHDALKPVLTVAENVRFWASLHDHDGQASWQRTEDALTRLDLLRLRDYPCKMLSAGQKRRANLARLLAAPAQLWLLDEPATALDRASVATLEAIIADYRAAGGMVVLSTHQDITLPGAEILHLDRYASKHPVAAAEWLL